jgi:hypothetical protein
MEGPFVFVPGDSLTVMTDPSSNGWRLRVSNPAGWKQSVFTGINMTALEWMEEDTTSMNASFWFNKPPSGTKSSFSRRPADSVLVMYPAIWDSRNDFDSLLIDVTIRDADSSAVEGVWLDEVRLTATSLDSTEVAFCGYDAQGANPNPKGWRLCSPDTVSGLMTDDQGQMTVTFTNFMGGGYGKDGLPILELQIQLGMLGAWSDSTMLDTIMFRSADLWYPDSTSGDPIFPVNLHVELDDFGRFAEAWGQADSSHIADYDEDGFVGLIDFGEFASHYDCRCPENSPDHPGPIHE